MSSNKRQGTGRWPHSSRARAGFTLAEVLAALLFMAIVIPVAMQGLQIAGRAGAAAARRSVAVQLADSQLNELIVTGNWKGVNQSGDFGNRWPGYRWTMRNEIWTGDTNMKNMHLLTIEVAYPSPNQNSSVRLSTLMQDTL